LSGFGADLARRVGTAAVVLPALAASLFLGPPPVFLGVAALAVLVGLGELDALARRRGLALMRVWGVLATAVVFAEMVRPGWLGPPGLAGLVVVGAASSVVRPGDLGVRVPSLGVTLFAALYLGGLGGTIAALRVIEPVEDGAWRVVLLLATVMVADTVALLAGRFVGRHRLAPALSPGKTVEGALAGVAGGAAAALAVRELGLPALSAVHAAALGLLVSAAGTAGDLFESLLKRWAGVKDSGSLFPGHGGMLDRLDSLLFGGPILYCYFHVVRPVTV
jgi:phosphatidate cytidylyltransferase